MEIYIKWNICRLCLREEEKKYEEGSISSYQLRHLFNEDKKLSLHIYELFGVFMKPDDSLPDKICGKCVSIINDAVQLRTSCRSSNTYLQSVLKRTKSASTFLKPDIMKSKTNNEIVDKEMELELGKNEDDAQVIKTDEILEHQDEVQREAGDDVSDDAVELEQIIEISEGDHIFMQSIENETDEDGLNPIEKCIKPEPSQLTKFYMSSGFLKLKSTEDDSDNSKENNNELYDSSNLDDIPEDLKEHEDPHSGTDKCFEYVTLEEEEETLETNCEEALVLQAEENINENENQEQVSSTVETNDQFEYYEHKSNASNFASDVDEDSLVNTNLKSCYISSSKQSTQDSTDQNLDLNKTGIKPIPHVEKKQNVLIVSPRRKIKRNFHKKSKRGQVQECVCEICGNQFTNRNLMNIHMRVHYQEKNHECELCSKRFITACNLQAHMRIHTGEKPFQCKYCGRRFSDRSSNLRHERIHTNEKPFDCDSCGKSFSLFTTLQNHMKVHTNERSYRCEPCGKSFKLPHHLKAHQNTSLHRSMVQIDNVDAI